MSRRSRAMLHLCVLIVPLSGCRKYQPSPLAPAEVFDSLRDQRNAPDGADLVSKPFTLIRAADWLRRYGPDVQEALAEYRTALARAKIDTPLPNPGLEIGPQFGFGPDLGRVNEVTPFGSIGFTIPLGKRLRRQTELNRALAEVARVHALARFRELYLELRSSYAQLAIDRQRLATRQEIAVSAEQTTKVGRKLVEAGQATSLDVALFELEHQRSQREVLTVEREIVDAEGRLSRLLGVHFERFGSMPERSLPSPAGAVPSDDQLQEQLVGNHAELARLRAQYEAAERSLRLEISKQFPDLQIGPGWENEVGERKTVIGLTLGIEIPLFDRNQQGIAEAQKKREEIRVKYEAEARRSMAELERAHRELVLARRNAALIREQMLPLAQKNVELAHRSVQAGTANTMQLLEAERSLRVLSVETLEADMSELKAWIAVENAVGCPVITFPGEEAAGTPPREVDADPSIHVREPMESNP